MTFKIATELERAKGEERHPGFNKEAKGKYGRVHLPIAPNVIFSAIIAIAITIV